MRPTRDLVDELVHFGPTSVQSLGASQQADFQKLGLVEDILMKG